MVVSVSGDSPMIAPLRLLLSVALSVGLASTAFASSSVEGGNVDGTFAAGYKIARGISNGVIFSGNFVGPVTWTLTTLGNGTQNYALAGVWTGAMSGAVINAVTVQLTANVDRESLTGSAAISGADTTREESVPEPSTLALFGTGSLGLLGVVARRRRQP
jgi:hypothetical protein